MQKLLHEGVEVETSVDGFTAVDFPEVTAEKQERRHPVDTVVMRQFELAPMIERVNGRFVSLRKAELTKLGVEDIGPAQTLVLMAIGDVELTVGELLDRGHYVGSNISYYLKQLTDGGYVDRVTSQRDKRSARIQIGRAH